MINFLASDLSSFAIVSTPSHLNFGLSKSQSTGPDSARNAHGPNFRFTRYKSGQAGSIISIHRHIIVYYTVGLYVHNFCLKQYTI